MNRNLVYALFLIACTLTLSGCVTDSVMAKLNAVRGRVMPGLEKQYAATDLRLGAPAYVRIFKEEGILETFVRNDQTGRYDPFRTYDICGYSGYLGPKVRSGDKQAPEGFYDVTLERLFPQSKYHLAMNIGYPNEYDAAHGRTGNALMIHGTKDGKCFSEGCYALKNADIEDLYIFIEQSILAGNPDVQVHIFPFRMTDANMARYAAAGAEEWMPFWMNLKQGYDLFEQNRVPPTVGVRDRSYVFMPQIFRYASGV
jgi:murein L,D-transpeptidase YafK